MATTLHLHHRPSTRSPLSRRLHAAADYLGTAAAVVLLMLLAVPWLLLTWRLPDDESDDFLGGAGSDQAFD